MNTLENVFSSLPHNKVLFVRPGGNWGDYLIYAGADLLAARCGLDVTTLDHAEFMAQPVEPEMSVYLHGGGGLNPWTSGRALKGFVHALEKYDGPIIQGPQTIADDPAYLRELVDKVVAAGADKTVYLFAREQLSYDNLKRVFDGTAIRICIDRDTALHAKRADLVSERAPANRYHLDALRQDNERTGQERLLAQSSEHIVLDPAVYAKSFDHWVRIHAASRSIRTNRTHSAILGAVLGVPTTLFASSSHKNRSIWQYSLESRHVDWLDTPDSTQQEETGPNEPVADTVRSQSGRAGVVALLKKRLEPLYRVVNLPRMRARMTQRVDDGKKQLERLNNTRHGVPWR